LKADFDESGYTDPQKVVLKALKTHGMQLSDGGEIPLTFTGDRTSTAKWTSESMQIPSARSPSISSRLSNSDPRSSSPTSAYATTNESSVHPSDRPITRPSSARASEG
jgi:hypothetical protein